MTFSLSHPFILPSIHAVHTYSTTSISQEEKHTSKERKILLSRVLPSNKRISSSKQTHTPGRQKRKNLLSLLEPNKETYWKPYYKENLLRKPNKYKSKDWILMVSSCENNSWNSSTTRQNNSSSSLLTLAPASASELKPATLAPTRHDAGKPRKQAQCQEGA